MNNHIHSVGNDFWVGDVTQRYAVQTKKGFLLFEDWKDPLYVQDPNHATLFDYLAAKDVCSWWGNLGRV